MDILYKGYTGSRMYGLETEKSDTDKIIIYKPSYLDFANKACYNSELRFFKNVIDKDDNGKNKKGAIDLLYIDIYTFINEVLNGSPNHLEVVYSILESSQYKNSTIFLICEQLADFVKDYDYYIYSFKKIMVKYLKKSKRDKENSKDLYHVLRCYYQIDYFLKNRAMNFGKMYINKQHLLEIKNGIVKNIEEPIDKYCNIIKAIDRPSVKNIKDIIFTIINHGGI